MLCLTATEPVVTTEVVSKDSGRTDRLAKLMEHQSLASVRCYVMLEENQVFAAVITRAPDHWGF